MKSICLILPWFGGPFKNYFPFFLESCKSNPTVNWLVFTDSNRDYDYPENVKVCNCTFEEIRRRIQKKFDFRISLSRPYKLCDFRPAYGEIFADEIKNFDFWGYCDCDVIFGNIRKFVTDDILESYKMIFTRGHFHLFRNDLETNAFYRTINYKEVFETEKSFIFDEWAGISGAWDKSGKDYYDELVMDDLRVGLRTYRPTKELSNRNGPYHRKNEDLSNLYKKMKRVYYKYDAGSLYRVFLLNGQLSLEEVMYVHFQKRNLIVNENLQSYANYYVIKDSFTNRDEYSASLNDFFHDLFIEIKLVLVNLVKCFISRG